MKQSSKQNKNENYRIQLVSALHTLHIKTSRDTKKSQHKMLIYWLL